MARRLVALPLDEVLTQTAAYYGVDAASFATKHSKEVSRDVAAWLARRLTVSTLRELSESFGLGHPDSVRGLINRTERAMAESPQLRCQINELKKRLQSNSTAAATKHEKRI